MVSKKRDYPTEFNSIAGMLKEIRTLERYLFSIKANRSKDEWEDPSNEELRLRRKSAEFAATEAKSLCDSLSADMEEWVRYKWPIWPIGFWKLGRLKAWKKEILTMLVERDVVDPNTPAFQETYQPVNDLIGEFYRHIGILNKCMVLKEEYRRTQGEMWKDRGIGFAAGVAMGIGGNMVTLLLTD